MKAHLPISTTLEELETAYFTDRAVFLTYGNRILMAWYNYQERKENSYRAATYEFTTRDHSCEGEIMLTAESDEYFEDNGRAIAWAMNQ